MRGFAIGNEVQTHQMMINGDAADIVNIAGQANWPHTVAGQVTANGHTYDVYNTTTATQAQLLIDHNVIVSFIA